MEAFFARAGELAWGWGTMALFVGVGVYFTVRLRFLQVTHLGSAPGPPAHSAVATPTMFPVPIVAASAVHSAL